jgi:type IV pilus assembly protein PilE
MKKLTTWRAFSLLELLVALAMIALLLAVGVPSYQQHLAYAHRMQAKAQLMAASFRLEQYVVEHPHDHAVSLSELGLQNNPYYRFSFEPQNKDQPYRLMATPKAGQAKRDSDCGVLMLNGLGEKTASGTLGSACWS